jgi:hypothetical protein
MIESVLQVGDEVVITIPQENREFGYNPCPDGSRATVLGFGEIDYGRINNMAKAPGTYLNRAWTKVLLENGHRYTEYTGRLQMTDRDMYRRRVSEWQSRRESGEAENEEFLRDLPDTPFWEGDKVSIRRTHPAVTSVYGPESPTTTEPKELVVVRIRYRYLTDTRHDGSQYPAYHVSDKLGGDWDTTVSEQEMTLMERGNVWRHFHGKQVTFADLREEANFYVTIGQTCDVRNPDNGLYRWTKDEVLGAIKNGIVDSFMMGGGMFGSTGHIQAIKFRNEDLGRRVSAMTLEGFGIRV